MRHARPLAIEGLESRMLLTGRARHVAARAAAAAVEAPITLDGTLSVNQKAATSSMDGQGDTTMSIPVSGTLAGLGKVRGYWDRSLDPFGDYSGPDTIQLRTSQGAIEVAFNDGDPGNAHRTATGLAFHPLPQHVLGGTGSYAKAVEIGTIVLSSKNAKTGVTRMMLNSTNP